MRERRFRIVVDYGFSGASYVLPLVLGPLGVEVVAAHAFTGEGPDNADAAPGLAAVDRPDEAARARRSAPTSAPSSTASAERLYLIDEQAHEVPVEQALLLFLRLIGSNGRRGKLAFPVTVTSQVDRLVDGLEPRDRPHAGVAPRADPRGRAREASSSPAPSAAATSSPSSCPATTRSRASRSCSSCSRPSTGRSRSSSPSCREPTLVHHQIPCPWALKGLVMRVLNERLAGRDLDLTDGIKLFDERGWAQVLPDPDEPLIHLYAEGETPRGVGGACARVANSRRRDRARRGRRRTEPSGGRRQRLKFSLTLVRALHPGERLSWNRCPTSRRCPTRI